MPAARAGRGLIRPAWANCHGVGALATTRLGGVSRPPYDTFNLGRGVGDEPERVDRNRRSLIDHMGVGDIQWLDQEHGTTVLAATVSTAAGAPATADAAWTADENLGLAILTADCVPLLLADLGGGAVAAAHCGWRGTVGGVVEATVDAVPVRPQRLSAWLGPGICGRCYEVGADVVDRLEAHERAVVLTPKQSKWCLDLPSLIGHRLQRAGVRAIEYSGLCTHCDGRFFSYRRDGLTGRSATLIWRHRPATGGPERRIHDGSQPH